MMNHTTGWLARKHRRMIELGVCLMAFTVVLGYFALKHAGKTERAVTVGETEYVFDVQENTLTDGIETYALCVTEKKLLEHYIKFRQITGIEIKKGVNQYTVQIVYGSGIVQGLCVQKLKEI